MEDFVSFEIAKKLKEKGVNWTCSHYYRTKSKDLFMIFPREDWSNIEERKNAPTLSQVLKWLREEKKLFIEISCNYTDYFPTVRLLDSRQTDYIRGDVIYSTYEQAALAGVNYCLDNLM